MKVLAVCQPYATFVKQDLQILRELGYDVVNVPPVRNFWLYRRLARQADVIFSWWAHKDSTPATLLARGFNKPLVMVLGGREVVIDPTIPGTFANREWHWRQHVKFNLRNATILLSPSEWLRKQASEIVRHPRNLLVYNGVDTSVFKPLPSQKKYAVVACGLQTPGAILIKGMPELIESFVYVLREFPHARLVLVGDDLGGRAYLISMTRRLGLDKNVDFVNYSDFETTADYARFLNMCQVYVQFSRCEAFGVAMVEAMACGLPVIASSRTALPEIVGCDEMIVLQYAPKELANKIISILSDNECARRLGEYCASRARERFSKEIRKEKLGPVFEEVTDSRL